MTPEERTDKLISESLGWLTVNERMRVAIVAAIHEAEQAGWLKAMAHNRLIAEQIRRQKG